MAKLSPARQEVSLLSGLPLVNRGKVRDTYDLGDGKLLVVASDGISIFDFVLNALVPQKGQILTALSHFWFRELDKYVFPHHLVAAGGDIDPFLPSSLRGNAELLTRALVVKRLEMVPVEFVARACLTGSGLKEYRQKSTVSGYVLPGGFQDGDELPYILDTPTTKAEEGHDEALLAGEIRKRCPEETYLTLAAFQIGSAYARACGIVIADTKFEFGRDRDGAVCLGDEVFTPDSSRFWARSAWQESRKPDHDRKAPPPYDKQLVRAWGIDNNIHTLDPLKPDHVRHVHALTVPPRLIAAATRTYRYIFWRLIGRTLEEYSTIYLGVGLERPKKRVAIILGSESDKDAAAWAVKKLGVPETISRLDVHVISCHRNPGPLRKFVDEACLGAEVIVAAGSKALALPGVLDALINAAGLDIPVVGVALGDPWSEALQAAVLSIKQLPGEPVVMDEISGTVYCGAEGFAEALKRVDSGELPPPKVRVEKPPKFNVDLSA